MPKPKVEWVEVLDAMTEMMDGLEAWATASAEGFTEAEVQRMNGYLELLDRVDDMIEEDTKIARFLAL